MKIMLPNAVATLDQLQRDADKLHTQELRKAIEKYLEEQKEQIKTLRRMMN